MIKYKNLNQVAAGSSTCCI